MSNDITTVLTEEDIAQVLGELDIPASVQQGLDFGNSLLYHLEERLENHLAIVGNCHCTTPLGVRDLKRGYCENCFAGITVKASGKAIDK